MAVPVSSSPDVGEETNLEEVVLELSSQLEESQQDFRDLKEKFLICKCTAYSLASQLQKYECDKDNDLLASVLGEMMRSNDRELAERLTLEEQLRESNIIIARQSQELSELRDRLRRGRNVSSLISDHLWELLTLHGSDSHKLHELLVSVYKLTDCLILKLSPEKGAEEESGKEEGSLAPRLSEEGQEEEEVKETLQDSLTEGHISSHSGLSDVHQPLCSSADLLESQHNPKEEEEEEPTAHSSVHGELQEEKECGLLPEEQYFSCSGHPDSTESPEVLQTSVLTSNETGVSSAVDRAKLNLDACTKGKNPPKLEDADVEESALRTPGFQVDVLLDATSLLTGKMVKRKLRLGQWKIACQFPGLQSSENCETEDDKDEDSLNSSSVHGELQEEKELGGHPNSTDSPEVLQSSVLRSNETEVSSAVDGAKLNLGACTEAKNTFKTEGDDFDNSPVKAPGFEVDVLLDVTTVLSVILKKKQLLSNWRRAWRFPGLQASENHETGDDEDSLLSSDDVD